MRIRYAKYSPFFAAGLITLVLSIAHSAVAKDRRIISMVCGLTGTPTCPFIDDSDFLASSITTLNANFGVTGSYTGKACMSFWNANGNTCGTAGSSNGSAEVTIPTSLWSPANRDHFKYVALSSTTNLKGLWAFIP